MRFAATLTVGGVLGFIILEALKILLAPLATWLLGIAMVTLKMMGIAVGLALLIGVGVFVYRRANRDRVEVG